MAHEVGDHAMEGTAFEVERLSTFAGALLTCAQSSEVFSRFGNGVGSELHHNAPCGSATNGHVEKHLRITLGFAMAAVR